MLAPGHTLPGADGTKSAATSNHRSSRLPQSPSRFRWRGQQRVFLLAGDAELRRRPPAGRVHTMQRNRRFPRAESPSSRPVPAGSTWRCTRHRNRSWAVAIFRDERPRINGNGWHCLQLGQALACPRPSPGACQLCQRRDGSPVIRDHNPAVLCGFRYPSLGFAPKLLNGDLFHGRIVPSSRPRSNSRVWKKPFVRTGIYLRRACEPLGRLISRSVTSMTSTMFRESSG